MTGGFSRSSFALLVLLANMAFVGLYQTFHRMVISAGEEPPPPRRGEHPFMAAAMLVSLAVLLVLGLWLPRPLGQLLQSVVAVIGGRT